MQLKLTLQLIVCLSLFTLACSPIYYVPNIHNVPAMSSQGDVRLSAAGGEKTSTVQSAFAISDLIGIQMNGYRFNESGYSYGSNAFAVDAGIGIHRKVNPQMIFEAYYLRGAGKTESRETISSSFFNLGTSVSERISAETSTRSVQLAISHIDKYYSFSISAKIQQLNFSNVSSDLTGRVSSTVQFFNQHDRFYFFEPAATLRVGYKNVFLFGQTVISRKITTANLKYEPLNINIGVLFRLGQNL
jgi:hypothetical protein